MTALVISNVVLWVAVVLLALSVYSLTRLIREFLTSNRVATARTGAGLAVASPAVPFSSMTISGKSATVGANKGIPTYLLFTSGGCMVCEELVDQLAHHVPDATALPGELIIVSDAVPEYFAQWPDLANSAVQILAKSDLYQHYRVPKFPQLVIVDSEGNIARYETVDSWRSITQIIGATRFDLRAIG